jgi:penicillin-binding protein 2
MLQVVQTHAYRTQSEENSVRIIPIRAPRGEILDRNGVVLAKNKQVFSVTLTQNSSKDSAEVIQRLIEILSPAYPEINEEYIQAQIKKYQGRRYEPILIKRDIDMTMLTRIEEKRQELPGVSIEVEPIRDYPLDPVSGHPLAGHILGFVREINADEIAEWNRNTEEGRYYQSGDLIGKSGLEKSYENHLRGIDGARQVEVNAYNREVSKMMTIPAISGNSIVLTLDAKLQQVMESSLDETLASLQAKGNVKAKAGAAVVIDVKTGAILAMASRPFLDPNDFIGTMSQELADFYYTTQPAASINRVIASAYPPGSTFKPITAMAALESHAITANQRIISCTGRYPVKPYIRCTGHHGPVDLYSGMAKSCNSYFQEAGRLAGPERMVMVGQQFGLGAKTGIDLPGEVQGVLPSPQWKMDLNTRLVDNRYQNLYTELEEKYQLLIAQAPDEQTREKYLREKEQERRKLEALYNIDYRFATSWQPYDTFNMSIGQGSNNYTPLQLANYVATLANGGNRYRPYLVDRIVSVKGEVLQHFSPTLLNQTTLSPEILSQVRESMEGVMQPGGTAYSLFADFPPTIRVAGKTGTAQTGRQGDDKNRDFHGVFVAFAPADDPQIAFAGIIEYGGHGSASSGYVARAVFQEYFGLNQLPELKTPTVTENTPTVDENSTINDLNLAETDGLNPAGTEDLHPAETEETEDPATPPPAEDPGENDTISP